jgi:putative two-component system response regulator
MENLSNCTVLVVDDTESNLDILTATLNKDYGVSVAKDGESALEIIESQPPDLVLLDICMPGIDGYEVCRRLKRNLNTRDIPVVFITGMNQAGSKKEGFKLGAVDYITKPFEIYEVRERVRTHLTNRLAKKILEHQNSMLENKIRAANEELSITQQVTIECIASLAETRDPETGGHIKRTKLYVRALAEHLKTHPKFSDYLTEEAIDLLYKSAPLHDIGKVGIPDSILLSTEKLTPDEWEMMKKHCVYGRDALHTAEAQFGEISFLKYAKEIAYYHHERWDGTGYPEGLSGEDIPVSGRLMALADVYDALISKRVYKPPFSHTKAVRIIIEDKGKYFDPDVVDAFLELEETFRMIALQFADFDEERATLEIPIDSAKYN